MAKRYRTLLEITNAVIGNLKREDLLPAICAALKRAVAFDAAALSVYDRKLDGLRFFALEGDFRSNYFVAGLVMKLSDSVSGEAFLSQRPVVRRDLMTEQHYPSERHLAREGVRSTCIAPLLARGKSIGTINLTSFQKNQYSQADGEFLQEVANQIALAIANMQAFEDINALSRRETELAERRRILLEINNAMVTSLTREELLKTVSQVLRQVAPADQIGIMTYNPDKDAFRILAIVGPHAMQNFAAEQWLAREAIFGRLPFDREHPLLEPDFAIERRAPQSEALFAEGFRSFCGVPIINREQLLGGIGFVSRTPNQYSQTDAEFLQEIADQVALAIANMRAYEEIASLKARLQAENIYLQEEIRQEHNFDEVIGNSPAILETLQQVERVAPTDSTVLILGETGTGKELIARAIHNSSARKNRPLVKVNCGAISAGLVESELFGHAKGAFTGAVDKRTGRFELASGGTLFLDEVGELPLETQVKLLRVLQEGEFEPVGSSKTIRVDVRIIAATNRHLEEEVSAGRFRADLYYRLNVFPIRVPALRERRLDIAQLASFFATKFARKFGKPIESIAQETMDMLMNYSWPGNIRELQNIIERAVVIAPGNTLVIDKNSLATTPNFAATYKPADLQPANGHRVSSDAPHSSAGVTDSASHSGNLPSLEELERRHILTVLEQKLWIIEGERGAAKTLNLHPNTLRSRMKKLGIKRPHL
ncbi:MAG: sigma 54-interacting transcriptional regulator [Acidobacteriota bacterium]